MKNNHKLVEKYMPMANKLACQKKRSLPSFIDVDELKSAAYMGLVEAASRFNPELGIAFSTFAYPRISGAINDYLRELGWGKKSDPTASVSLDIPNEHGVTQADLIEARVDQGQEELFEAMTVSFDDQAKEVLRNYFIDECSMKEVGEKFNVSESRISQLIKQYKIRICQDWTSAELAA